MNAFKRLAAAGALCACLAPTTIVTAQDTDQYKVMYTLKLETGKTVEMPFNFVIGYPSCLQAKKKVEVGKVIPRGVLVTADGKSPSATIVSAKCVLL